MVVYFTGTGNSRWCAEKLADLLNDELLDASGYIKNGIAADLRSGRPWVFVAPTYAWQMAHIFEEFLRAGWFDGNEKVYFFLTCGGDTGNAGEKLAQLSRDKGWTCMGTQEVIMPENYVAMFPVPDEEECRQIVERAKPLLEEAAARIRKELPLENKKTNLLDRLKSGPVNAGFYRFFVKSNNFIVTEKCISCTKCVSLCPLNNIHLECGRPVWGSSCTHCMACICHCPAEAIEYGRRTSGKRRYRCPDIP